MTEANGDQTPNGKKILDNHATKGSQSSGTMDQYMIPVALKNLDEKGKEEAKKNGDFVEREVQEHWTTVTDGPSRNLVKIKKEIVEKNNENQFAQLNAVDEEHEDDDFNEDDDMGDIYGVETSEEEVDIATFERVAKEAIEDFREKDFEMFTIADLSETLFTIHRCKNHKLTRAEIYLKDKKWVQQQLQNEIRMYNEKEFVTKVDRLAKNIKLTQLEDKDNVEVVTELVKELHDISGLKTSELTDDERVKILVNARTTIKLIEEYAKDPLIMVPKEMIRLDSCIKDDITTINYYQLAMAVMYAQGDFNHVLTKTRKQLVIRAEELWRDQQLKNKNGKANISTPTKKSKSSKVSVVTPGRTTHTTHVSNNPTNLLSSKKTEDMLAKEHQKRKADRREQAQNLNGINITNMTPDETQESFNFCVPNASVSDKGIKKIKHSYFIHNRIHVENAVNAQKVVQMLFRVLRKADPTVLMLPYAHTTSQEKFIETEENIPETESELKTYISVAKRQFAKKFGFSMRISITESPVLVKNRIFDWCKGQKHFVEFKQMGSANIFAAGWLYKLHQNFYNRDHIREWMTKNCPALENHVHLAPAKLFKEEAKGEGTTRTITFGIRVEITFEKKEEILQQLYQLSWKNGPYKDALFVPFRSNQEYTEEMQIQLMKQHKQYIDNEVQQKVFRMKGSDWEIKNQNTGNTTTFKKWMMGLTVNGKKILNSVETGDDFYVRMIYHPDDHKNIQYIYRHLYDTTLKAFGEECTQKMFCLPQSPLKGDLHALEENYAKVLQGALQSNPQQDEEDKINRSKQFQRRQRSSNVYFGTSNVERSYASITKKTTMEEKNNGSNKMEEQKMNKNDIASLKMSILKEVTQKVDVKLTKFESKIENQMQQMKSENDAKIDSLAEMMKHNQTRNEINLSNQLEDNNKVLMQQITQLFTAPSKTPRNPPDDSVEQSSRDGGRQN